MAAKGEHASGASHNSDKDASRPVSQGEVGSGEGNDPNNFANDRGRVAAAGRKGGRESHNRA